MGDLPSNRLAVSFYGGVMLLMALAFVLMRWHLHRHPGLLQESVDRKVLARGTVSSVLMGPAAYAFGAALAWWNVVAAFVCYAAIAAYFALPRRAQGVR